MIKRVFVGQLQACRGMAFRLYFHVLSFVPKPGLHFEWASVKLSEIKAESGFGANQAEQTIINMSPNIAINKPDLFDVVELKGDLPESNLTRGARGTIVEYYPDGEYEVEFVDGEGQTLALCALTLDKISIVHQATTKYFIEELFEA